MGDHEILLELIDIARDINKTIATHISNHSSSSTVYLWQDESCMVVCTSISSALESLEKKVERSVNGTTEGKELS